MANMNANSLDIIIGIVSPDFLENITGGNGLTVTLEKTVE
jgi:hypothetical protein